jgi:hypothetical protein
MKKLIYSTFVALISSALFVGCDSGSGGGNGGNGGSGPVKPSITFQTNNGSQSGFTFASGNAEIGTTLKFGVKINSTVENIKSTKLTVKFNNQNAQLVGTDSIISGNTKDVYREYTFKIPNDKGTYTFTFSATDKVATTTTVDIVIQAYGKLTQKANGTFYSLKATSTGHFSAYDLLNGDSVTASGSANIDMRDIVDGSTSDVLSGKWNSQNGTQFVVSNSTLNGKVFGQFNSEQDILDAWNATSGKSSSISGIELGSLIIAKSTRNGSTFYYLISVIDFNDVAGSDNDYYTIQIAL